MTIFPFLLRQLVTTQIHQLTPLIITGKQRFFASLKSRFFVVQPAPTARYGLVQPAPNVSFGLVQPAPSQVKPLKTNAKNTIPPTPTLVAGNALFLPAKTTTAGSCVTCVKILRSTGPMNTSVRPLDPVRRNWCPAKSAVAVALLFLTSAPTLADGWSKSGSFTLSGDATEVSGSQWSLPVLEWQRSRNFEMASPGHVPDRSSPIIIQGNSQMAKLLSLISRAESPRRGYNAVHHGARRMPPSVPTSMTVGEVVKWINDTPGQNHAIGRYQIIPSTLAYLIEAEGIGVHERFNETLQDRLAFRLMRDAGWDRFRSGAISHSAFMDALAGVWAGLPKSNGRSAYHGYAGNRATISRASYEAAFSQIFP